MGVVYTAELGQGVGPRRAHQVELSESGTSELSRSASNWKHTNFDLTVTSPGDFTWSVAGDKITVNDSGRGRR
jgi:hypothetical protein